MDSSSFIDHYESLQLSPNADFSTIDRVYRLLAKKYHPDNKSTGDAAKFKMLLDAYRVLSDPEKRAAYDNNYDEAKARRWRLFFSHLQQDEFQEDDRMQMELLTFLYTARRRDIQNPGLGIYELEKFLGISENHLEFFMWYLKEKGWIQRTDNGCFAITAEGVDKVTRFKHKMKNKFLTEGNPV